MYAVSFAPNEVRKVALIRASRYVGHLHGRSLSTNVVAGSPSRVRIGDVELQVGDVGRPNRRTDLIPVCYQDIEAESQHTLRSLRWLMQKQQLKQDVFLLGPPGPSRRRLALLFAELTGREVEYLCITRDTTEADLKQRGEVVGGTLRYINQPPVNAALFGRLLIVDGIEKAERNVLPTLNNLLENREMALDDGSFLVSPHRYDALSKSYDVKEMKARGLLRVDPNFTVIALGLPVPRFPGYPLDPPLRSRFQARSISSLPFHEKIAALQRKLPSVPVASLTQLVSLRETIRLLESQSTLGMRFPHFPESGLEHLSVLLALPRSLSSALVARVYPYHLMCDKNQQAAIRECMQKFSILDNSNNGKQLEESITTTITDPIHNSNSKNNSNSNNNNSFTDKKNFNTKSSNLEIKLSSPSSTTIINTASGPLPPQKGVTFPLPSTKAFVLTPSHRQLIGPLLEDLSVGRSVCLVGDKGTGKSAFLRFFSAIMGYTPASTYVVHLFKDMTSRDLLMRRSTDSQGNTVWSESSVVRAARAGGLLVLDGLDRLPASAISVLASLIEDRELCLSNGSRLIREDRYEKMLETSNEEALKKLGIFPIPCSFRIVSLALPPDLTHPDRMWLREETMTLFSFHSMPMLDTNTKVEIVHSIFPEVDVVGLKKVIRLVEGGSSTVQKTSAERTAADQKKGGKQSPTKAVAAELDEQSAFSLSLRQILRLIRRYSKYPEDIRSTIGRTVLLPFLPIAVRKVISESVLPRFGEEKVRLPMKIEILENENSKNLRIGDVTHQIAINPKNPELIPDIVFFDIPKHAEILQDLMKDLLVGEKNILLIGNQGVGKNKLADRLLQLLRLEREYMQLHRDTTVQALTLSPSLQAGVIVYEDSALVKAAKYGRVLVVDEADKAPLEVVSVLKGLLEDGQMILSDGRLILREVPTNAGSEAENIIPLHPNFKVIVLANRPGFPFLGNDFFREIGDVFACHIIDNPDKESERILLKSYGPEVDTDLIGKLVDAFSSLRVLVEEGTFSYPYSTRELVNIVKHLQTYPNDGVLSALENVFSFDSYDSQLFVNLQQAFAKHGIPLYDVGANSNPRPLIRLTPPEPLPPPVLLTTLPPQSSSDAHVDAQLAHNTFAPKSWLVDMGVPTATVAWNQGRLHTYSEEKASWKAGGSRMLGVCSLPDGSIHVLSTLPLAIHSYFPSTSYSKCVRLELDEFLLGEAASQLRLEALSSLGKIAVFSPSGYVVVVRIPDTTQDSSDKAPASVAVLPYPDTPAGGKSLLDYISPGFKMGQYFRAFPLMAGGSAQEPVPRSVPELSHCGYLNFYTPNTKSFTLIPPSTSTFITLKFPFVIKDISAVYTSNPNNNYTSSSSGGKGELCGRCPACLTPERLLFESIDHSLYSISFASIFNTSKTSLRLQQISPSSPSSSFSHSLGSICSVLYSPPSLSSAFSSHPSSASSLSAPPSSPLPAPLSSILFTPDANYLFRAEAGGNRFVEGQKASLFGVGDISSPEISRRYTQLQLPLYKSAQFCAISRVEKGEQQEFLTLVEPGNLSVRHISLPIPVPEEGSKIRFKQSPVVGIAEVFASGDMVSLQEDGSLRLWEVDRQLTEAGAVQWRRLFGISRQAPLRLEYDSDNKREAKGPKHGESDGKEHHGGNRFKGGTGGADTAGLGGRGGPYRIDAGFEVHQVSDEEKAKVPEEVKKAAREIGRQELEKKLKEIEMGTDENDQYEKYMSKVGKQIAQLRLIFEQAEAKKQEREWLRNQQQGDLDDMRLVDAITGEKTVYRRRGTATPMAGIPQQLPKRLQFVMDVSGSMFRFNGVDQRLERLMETTLLIMESLFGFDYKYSYAIVGHSGDGPSIPFVDYGKPPQNRKERLKVLQKMVAHAQYCQSGDNTLEATTKAIADVVKAPADDYFVFVISDANFSRYGISPADLARRLTENALVNVYAIFIASLRDEANELLPLLPAGRGFFTQDTADVPIVFKTIFSESFAE